jgi:DNA-binding response OmpR family regulator
VVDDNPINLGVVGEHLEDHDYDVTVAQDGEEALTRAQLTRPDLILLDVMMPGIDGFETCRRLKANPATADIPVIFMTALTDVNDKVAAFQAGGVDYISKPFQIEELLARVRTHLALAPGGTGACASRNWAIAACSKRPMTAS